MENYFYVCLRGKIKGEHKVRCHILPCVGVTGSGIDVMKGVGRLLQLKERQGFVDGPAISDQHGRVATTHAVNDCLMEALEACFNKQQDLFPMKIKEEAQIRECYHTSGLHEELLIHRLFKQGFWFQTLT